MKIVFGMGSFNTPLRIELSDSLIEKAEQILRDIERLVEKYQCEFSSDLAVQGQDDPSDYGRSRVWLHISAGPAVVEISAYKELYQTLTDKRPSSIILESGGPEDPNIIDYDDIRDIPNLYI